MYLMLTSGYDISAILGTGRRQAAGGSLLPAAPVRTTTTGSATAQFPRSLGRLRPERAAQFPAAAGEAVAAPVGLEQMLVGTHIEREPVRQDDRPSGSLSSRASCRE